MKAGVTLLSASGSSAARGERDVAIEAHGLKKAYDGLVAVDDLSFAARAGEVIGLLGPNGAGKTTAIRVLTTILAPTAGRFAVAGSPHTRPAEIRGRIGVLPESAGYPEQQTGAEFLVYHARLFGHSRDSARATATALLSQVGLADRGGSPIATYSRGMRQRLGIARALVNDPMVVFFDEPTLGLDPAGQRQVLRLVESIAGERGATVVLTTHLLAEVEQTCNRVLILNRGRLVAEGSVAEVTRLAAAPRRARLRVSAESRDRALAALARVPALGDARAARRPPRLGGGEPEGLRRRAGLSAGCGRRGRDRACRRGSHGARLRARGRTPERRLPGDDGGRFHLSAIAHSSTSGRRWAVVAGQELRDLWLSGRGLVLLFAFSVLVSAITYLGATSEGVNFLEKRETVNLTLQVAVAFGALVALLAAADAISGERERGTLESLLLTPVPRRHLVTGKLLASLSLWFAAIVVAVPYLWFLGRDVGAVDDAVIAGFLVGTLVALSLTAFGIIVSVLASTNRLQPLGEPVRPAGALRADPAPRGRQAGLGRRAAAARQPDDGGGALHAEHRHQPVRLDEGAVLAHLTDRRRPGACDRRDSRSATVHLPARERRRMSTVRLLGLGLACLLVAAPAAAAQTSATEAPVAVALDRTAVSTALGDSFRFASEIRNTGRTPVSGLVAHLNVVGLSSGIYVDPEDWSEERTKDVPSLGPGESTSISWRVKAVTGGHAAIYVVALPDDPAAGSGGPAVSPAMDVRIAESKDLNSGGVLPLALGVPALLGLATLGARRRRRG